MGRWEGWRGWSGHLRWLRPGLGVKRWLALLLAGIALLILAVTDLPKAAALARLWHIIERLHIPTVDPAVEAVVFALSGSLLIGVAVYNLNRSLLSAYRRGNQSEVVDVVYRHRQRQRGPKVVAIGGGHGLHTLLRGLKEHTDHITAIVTVADDGGSSGRLRRDLGMLPPGDFRNCLAALSDAEGLVGQLMQYRFGADSDLEGHSFGNLYLTAMTAITGSFEAALAESSRVLAVRGQVIPSTLSLVTLCAEVLTPEPVGGGIGSGLRLVRGESRIGRPGERVQRVYLEPEDVPAYPGAIRAILEADLIVIGPGSLYTSVLPNLLVPDLARALAAAAAPKVYVCNVATQAGETEGYDVEAHVNALQEHIGSGVISLVLANDNLRGDPPPGIGVDWVRPPSKPPTRYKLLAADLVDAQYAWRHDSRKLAQALMSLLEQ